MLPNEKCGGYDFVACKVNTCSSNYLCRMFNASYSRCEQRFTYIGVRYHLNGYEDES